MMYYPCDWNKYTIKEKQKFLSLDYKERKRIVLDSYLSMITNDKGELDKYKILDLILELQDQIDDINGRIDYR